MLISSNTSNFMFGLATVGKVTLTATTTGVQILPQTCYLQVEGEKGNAKYSLNQGVDVKSNENLVINCKTINTRKEDITATPKYETHLRSTYGDVVSQTGGDMTPILFKSNIETPITLTLPKASNSQAYNVNLGLVDGSEESNMVSAHYVLVGSSATIQNLSFNKDYYTKGETATISLMYTPSADNFPGSRYQSEKQSALTTNIKFTNGKGKTCAKDVNQKIEVYSPKLDIPVSITSNCFNPKVLVTLSDESGKVLDQKDFTVKTTSVKDSNSNMAYIIISILIIVMIGFYIYKKKKNGTTPTNNTPSVDTSIPMSIIFPFLIFAALTLFTPTNKVSADTFWVNDVNYGGRRFDINFNNGKKYDATQPVVISASTDSDAFSRGEFKLDAKLKDGNDSIIESFPSVFNSYIDDYYTSTEINFDAPAFAGIYTLEFIVETYSTDTYYHTTTYTTIYSTTIEVTETYVPPEPPAPTVTVYVNNSTSNFSLDKSVTENTGVTVSWKSTNATSCTCTTSARYTDSDGSQQTSCGTSGVSRIQLETGFTHNNSQNFKFPSTRTFTVVCNND